MKIRSSVNKFLSAFLLALMCSSSSLVLAQKTASDIYSANCASCHGRQLEGGAAGSLLDDKWLLDDSDASLASAIAKGIPDRGMPAWEASLTDEQIRALVIYIREARAQIANEQPVETNQAGVVIFEAQGHQFKLETEADIDGVLWGMDFLPDGRLLVTERSGELWLLDNGKTIAIENIPQVWNEGQGGLLDVAVHPEYVKNGWIYLSFADNRRNGSKPTNIGMTKVVRGKIKNNRWVKQQVIYSAEEKHHTSSGYHFGSRFVLDDGYLFFSVGDRGRQDLAQDLGWPNGKIFRLHDDGRIPKDNPFIGNSKALPAIWSYGHRNPQGMTIDSNHRIIWASEHGPRGGDEVNIIAKGANYGWPIITYGMNYDGTPITSKTHQSGMEQPKHHWTPSIAVSDIDFYSGDRFPKWRGKLLASSLKAQELRLLTLDKDAKEIADDKVILKNQGRIRDVTSSSDGTIYLLISSRSSNSGRVVRLVPVANEK